jgi:outer membrane protein assembly factor BamB
MRAVFADGGVAALGDHVAGQRDRSPMRHMDMPVGHLDVRAWPWSAVALFAVALAAVGCAAASGTTGGAGMAPGRASAAGTSRAGAPGCGPFPPRHAWAVEVTAAGRIAWQTPLAARGTDSLTGVSPLLAGPVAVFAQDGIVHGLRLMDGHPLWAWHGGQAVYGMWRWGGLVAVLTDQVGHHARITGLDTATGAVRWVLRVPGPGLLGSQVPTGGGGLAMLRSDGVLQVVSLADGRIRWARFAGRWPALAAADGIVMFGMGGRLTGYDASTGQVRWARAGLPGQTQVQVLAGLALVTSNGTGDYTTTALVAIDPASGLVEWRFDPGSAVTVLADGRAGLAVATYTPARRLYLLNPRTGRPLWLAATAIALGTVPLVTAASVVAVEGGVAGYPAVRLVSRDAATGKRLWARTLAATTAGPQPVLSLASQAIVQTTPAQAHQAAPLRSYHLATGRPAWQASMPTFAQAPPVPAAGGLLIQPADPGYACASTG